MKYVLFDSGLLDNPEAEVLLLIGKGILIRDCSIIRDEEPDMFILKAQVNGYDYFFKVGYDGKLYYSRQKGQVIFCVPDHYLELFNNLSETFIYNMYE